MRTHLPLSKAQRAAMDLLHGVSPEPGVVTSGKTGLYDGQAWINWRTAYALHDRGVARVNPYGEDPAEVVLAANVGLTAPPSTTGRPE